jgi:hypothetical protein
MSRSNPRIESSNPCKKFIEWNAEKGHFQFYNKETKQDEIINLERFLFLDNLYTIGGFNPKHKRGIYSNEIHSIKDETLNVRVFGNDDVSIVGTYSNIKEKLPAGAKFYSSIYLMFNSSIVNIKLKGSALNTWIEFCKSNKSYQLDAIIFKGKSDLKTNGATKYYDPIFSLAESTPEEDTKAIELDKELQDYFKGYKEGKTTPTPEAEVLEPSFDDIDL